MLRSDIDIFEKSVVINVGDISPNIDPKSDRRKVRSKSLDCVSCDSEITIEHQRHLQVCNYKHMKEDIGPDHTSRLEIPICIDISSPSKNVNTMYDNSMVKLDKLEHTDEKHKKVPIMKTQKITDLLDRVQNVAKKAKGGDDLTNFNEPRPNLDHSEGGPSGSTTLGKFHLTSEKTSILAHTKLRSSSVDRLFDQKTKFSPPVNGPKLKFDDTLLKEVQVTCLKSSKEDKFDAFTTYLGQSAHSSEQGLVHKLGDESLINEANIIKKASIDQTISSNLSNSQSISCSNTRKTPLIPPRMPNSFSDLFYKTGQASVVQFPDLENAAVGHKDLIQKKRRVVKKRIRKREEFSVNASNNPITSYFPRLEEPCKGDNGKRKAMGSPTEVLKKRRVRPPD